MSAQLKIDRMATGGDAIHIIEKSKKLEAKQFDDDKSKEADRRRMESLAKMKTAYDQKKLAIKNALKVDSTMTNPNKIVFSDAEDDPAVTKQMMNSKRKQPLFGEDDDEIDDDDFTGRFAVKAEYQGVRGAKLQKLNARHKIDGRFEMDASFLPDEGEQEETAANSKPIDDEREWQYGILERVIGHKLHSDGTAPPKEKNRFPQTIQRYDPTKQEHVKFLATNQKKRTTNDNATNGPDEATGVEVSKEQFYKVSGDLTSSLWSKSTGFSLLSMFGRMDEEPSGDKAPVDVYKVTPLSKGQSTKLANDMTNPFEFDSSDDEQQLAVGKVQKPDAKPKKSDTKSNKSAKLWQENFFFAKNDDRLKGREMGGRVSFLTPVGLIISFVLFTDGLTFFMPTTADAVGDDEQRHKQQEMRNIIKKKIKRSIKSKLPHGAKPNRHFRRFTRNL